jgi:transcription elongation factor Elf1
MTKCGICNQPESNDPKAHICEFNCGACGQYFDQDQADENNYHLADFCDAYDEE